MRSYYGDRNDSCEIVRRLVLFKENQAIAADFFKKRKSCSKWPHGLVDLREGFKKLGRFPKL